ncbi:MAG: hypothetical protein IKQ64_08235 [Bacteroidales bacterium]|nr:hypothetical protein [Bacteroidales bacterium]
MKNKFFFGAAAQALLLLAFISCEKFPVVDDSEVPSPVSLEELARIFSCLPLEQEHLEEVHTAVNSSLEYGYDEEYTMKDLFTSPGAGVGARSAGTKAPAERWAHPLRALLEDYLEKSFATRSGDAPGSAAEYISALTQSDLQIYWPYSDYWDGSSLPVVTFDPGGTLEANIGYEMHPDGSVREVVVTERMAMERPVWVMNRNDDSGFETIEMLRRRDPDWGTGGTVVVHKDTKSGDDTKTLVLKEFEVSRNYDSWFAGGSEFFVKAGAVEDFNASTEAEMRLYTPTITDFMIVVKRSQVGQKIPFHAVLVSEWTENLQSLAFMVTEDDGGTFTTWKCTAKVTIKSRSYGFDIEIPFRTRDDIVWRGQLTRSYFEKNNDVEGRFGDVWLTFGII